MRSLFLDTSTSKSVVSIIEDNNVLAFIDFQNNKLLSENIFILIDKCFKQANINPNEIDKIFVVTGPGSFTGVRIGVTIAKTYAWTLNKEVISISSLECMASTCNCNSIVSLIDARRGYVFAGVYDSNLNTIIKDQYVKLDSLKEMIDSNSVFVSLDEFDFATIKPNYDIVKIINKHQFDTSVKPHTLVPNYLKLTEAEEKRIKSDRTS
ncbi:MAG: tRNA (adenosine(37)-N6)-threonylcarbamoyltransferase complex dimerization subunit type 1 TsaB [Bacilli bacterium]|nr:tRNA (adenosine(37)-N6)-threonylcarbamoyltransferase complex dimerization subunit type 1 TsaB [Bacilli bacterium]